MVDGVNWGRWRSSSDEECMQVLNWLLYGKSKWWKVPWRWLKRKMLLFMKLKSGSLFLILFLSGQKLFHLKADTRVLDLYRTHLWKLYFPSSVYTHYGFDFFSQLAICIEKKHQQDGTSDNSSDTHNVEANEESLNPSSRRKEEGLVKKRDR